MFSVRNSRNFPDGAKIHNRALLSNYPRGFFAAQASTMHKNSYLWQSKQCHVEQSGASKKQMFNGAALIFFLLVWQSLCDSLCSYFVRQFAALRMTNKRLATDSLNS